ncbi:unnamed protein product [Lampetra fluviatilis]
MVVGFDPSQRSLAPAEVALCGALSGFVTRAAVSPLDVVKIRFQLQVERISALEPRAKYRGLAQAVRAVLREEGLAAFWKGHVPAQLLSITYSGVQFVTFERLTELVHRRTRFEATQAHVHFACGGAGACMASLVAQPLDTLRTRLAAQGEPRLYRGVLHAVVTMWRGEGLRGFYRGLSPTLAAVFPYAGLQFGFYNVFTRAASSLAARTQRRTGGLQTLVCGAAAGVLSKTLTYPCDLVKKRLQVMGFEQARRHFGEVRAYAGACDCVRRVLREEGLPGLYKGLVPSALKAAASTGLTFLTYELFSAFARSRRSSPPGA